ncbi:ethylbenzene dehydrogenase-related protein [Shewanella sedimentimangrovi]|uniref:Cytochrome c-552/DMSO reductase-like haem-binding domain-containing protein n=1 Tax=Shewanella sedimentimangrovi TaxID=2814293 RepID=A0ABX7R1M6_9GAMM|nr:ethylbenzene dehydrogenase-related protein [Shewanella sedimentimangrovi]QSX37711.1 hypothetical protein JYB85_02390 [Shewanella sedimentimangrovi]
MKSALPVLLGLLAWPLAQAEPLTLTDTWSEVNWNDVPVESRTLFFPGKVSFEWLNSSRHPGYQDPFFEQRRCNACHKDEEYGLGNMLVKGSQDSYPGKMGALRLQLQIAHDNSFLHVRARWQGQANKPARLHSLLTLENGQWQPLQFNAPAEEAFSIMWDDGSIPLFSSQGCFLSCHLPQEGKPAKGQGPGLKDYLAAVGAGNNKFLPASHSGRGTRAKPLSETELMQQQAEGQFADVWQWHSATSGVLGIVDDGWLLDSRYQDPGEPSVRLNFNPRTGEPIWMFNPEVQGRSALNKLDLVKQQGLLTLVEGHNTVPFDAAKLPKGALLPQYYVSRQQAHSSEIQRIEASWDKGIYTLAFKRPLSTGDSKTDKSLQAGKVYTFAIAIHDDNAEGRGHFVSFPISVSLTPEVDADIISRELSGAQNP